MQKIFPPSISLLNRMNYTRKFSLLWLVSLIAISAGICSLVVSLDRVIQPSQRQLDGLPLIEPIYKTVQYVQQHRGFSAALLGGTTGVGDRRVETEHLVDGALRAMEVLLPGDLTSNEDFLRIRSGWEQLRKEGLQLVMADNFALHTRLIEQIQSFEAYVVDEYGLTLNTEIATFYLIDATVNRLPHVLEHLGQLRAYGTGVLAEKQISDSSKARLYALLGEFDSSLNQLRISLERTARYNSSVRQSILTAYENIVTSAGQITGLVKSDLLTGHFNTGAEVFLDMSTVEIDKGYAQIHQALLPTARHLIEARIARSEKTLLLTVSIALLLFLLVVYLSVSIYYAIVGNIQLLVQAAHTFAEGDLSQRINLNTRDELSQIGDSFNKMADGFSAILDARQQAEGKLQEAKEKFQSLVESSSDWIWGADSDAVYTYASPKVKDLLGYEPHEVVGRTPLDLMSPEEKIRSGRFFEEVIQDKKPFARVENSHLHKDGHQVILETSGVPVFNQEHEFCGYRGIARDITERKQAEEDLIKLNASLEARVEERTHELKLARDQADAASQAKSSFLSNMSHEIRSPLTAVIGFSESLKTDELNKQEREKIISTIVRNGRHLLQVINDVLDLSKIEAGQLEVEHINTSIFMLMGEVDSLLGKGARDKGLEFSIRYHFPLPEKIVTGPTWLKQILVNLCSNAIKFTEQGSIKIEVSCDEDFRQIRFVVIDTGIGMTPEEAARIFDPFLQADSTTTRKYGGTGLGLSISDKLAIALDGALICESHKGQGSRFTLSIANHDEAQPVVIHNLEDVSSFDVQFDHIDIRPLSGSILLAEDSPDNQQLVAMYIRKTGAQLIIVDNGRQALEQALEREFDLILMDMQMPVMDGIEAIMRLRGSGYKGPIVCLTANAMQSDREKCEAAGVDGFLVKPIEQQQFYQVLNRYLTGDAHRTSAGENQTLQHAMQASPQYQAIIERFLGKLPQMLDDMAAALAGKNWDTLQTISHDLKGIGGAVGYPAITEKAGWVNDLVRQKKYDQLNDAWADLEELCHDVLRK